MKGKEDKEIKAYEKNMTAAVHTATNMKIQKFEDVMEAADLLYNVKGIAAQVETQKDTIINPFNEGIKSIRKMFKPVEESYALAESLVKEKIVQWHQAQWAKGKTTDNKISGLNGYVTVVERMRVQVEDASLIPRELCSPDMDKLEHALKAGLDVAGAKLIPSYTINAGKN